MKETNLLNILFLLRRISTITQDIFNSCEHFTTILCNLITWRVIYNRWTGVLDCEVGAIVGLFNIVLNGLFHAIYPCNQDETLNIFVTNITMFTFLCCAARPEQRMKTLKTGNGLPQL